AGTSYCWVFPLCPPALSLALSGASVTPGLFLALIQSGQGQLLMTLMQGGFLQARSGEAPPLPVLPVLPVVPVPVAVAVPVFASIAELVVPATPNPVLPPVPVLAPPPAPVLSLPQPMARRAIAPVASK